MQRTYTRHCRYLSHTTHHICNTLHMQRTVYATHYIYTTLIYNTLYMQRTTYITHHIHNTLHTQHTRYATHYVCNTLGMQHTVYTRHYIYSPSLCKRVSLSLSLSCKRDSPSLCNRVSLFSEVSLSLSSLATRELQHTNSCSLELRCSLLQESISFKKRQG